MKTEARRGMAGGGEDAGAERRPASSREGTTALVWPRSIDDSLFAACVAFGLLSLWLVFHPFEGIVHDAIIYMGQAQAWLSPQRYASDVLLGADPQASFTIYPALSGLLVDSLGQRPAMILLTLIGHGLWMAGAAYLSVVVTSRRRLALIVFLFLIVWPFTYGIGVFSYAEGFPTARPAAEALIMMAIAASIRQRRLWVAALTVGSFFLHPIIAATGAPIAAMLLFRSTRARCLLIGSGAAILAASLLTLWVLAAPVAAEHQAWLEALKTTVPYIFISLWTGADWRGVAWIVALLLVASTWSRGPLRAVSVIAIAGLALAFVLSYIAGDLLNSSFILRAQPWRFVWIAGALAVVAAGYVTGRLWLGGGIGRAQAALFLAVAALATIWSPALVLVLLVPYLHSHSRQKKQFRWLIWVIAALILCATVIASASLNSLLGLIKQMATSWQGFFAYPEARLHFFNLSIGETAAILMILLVSGQWLSRLKGWVILVPMSLVGLGLVGSVIHWDRTLPDVINARDRAPLVQQLTDGMPKGQGIYTWPSPRIAWFLLRRPSFYSRSQLAPAVFSKKFSAAIFSRRDMTRPLSSVLAKRPLDGAKAGALFRQLCAQWGEPRRLVLHQRIDAPLHAKVALGRRYFAKWSEGGALRVDAFTHLYSYTCPGQKR